MSHRNDVGEQTLAAPVNTARKESIELRHLEMINVPANSEIPINPHAPRARKKSSKALKSDHNKLIALFDKGFVELIELS